VQISESTLARLYTLAANRPRARRYGRHRANRTAHRRDAAHLGGRLRQELLARFPEERAHNRGRSPMRSRPPTEDVRPRGDRDISEIMELPATAPALGLQLRPGDRAHKALHLRLIVAATGRDVEPGCRCWRFRPAILNERRIASARAGPVIQDLEVTHSGGRQLDPEQVGPRFRGGFSQPGRAGGERWLQPPGARGGPGLAAGDDRSRRLPLLLRRACLSVNATWSPCSHGSPESPRSLHGRLRRNSDPELKESTRAASLRSSGANSTSIRAGHEPGRRSHPARLPRRHCGKLCATNHYQRDASGKPKATCHEARPEDLPELPKPRPDVRDLVLLTPGEACTCAWARWPAAASVVRRREDFPNRRSWPDEGAERQEHVSWPVGSKGGFFPETDAGGTRRGDTSEGTE